ncbi:MAG: 2-dehydro-3-deoxygalactonokinase [Roseomonas sp.]|nr:2-dehydro-3-deoxygalactonokinase [Roseomonas sp.]
MIGLDWGTTSLRAYRLDQAGSVLDKREGKSGILSVKPGGFADELSKIAGDWLEAGEKLVLISGMAGSKQGWAEAPYLACPASVPDIARATLPVPFPATRVRLVPGLKARDADGVPEVMRGEETQILGVLDRLPEQEVTLCLPGSHSKWVRVRGDQILDFSTHMTGEVFAALSAHTILARSLHRGAAHHAGAFARGLDRARQGGGLLHQLFGLRSLSLFDAMPQMEAVSYLSGLLIGHEVTAALEAGVAPPVHIIGAAALTLRYSAALAAFGIPSVTEAEDAAAAGLFRIGTAIEAA